MLAGMSSFLHDQSRKLFKEDIPNKLRAWIAGGVVALIAAVVWWWRSVLGGWCHALLGVDPEVGRQAVFFLCVLLYWSVFLAPNRRLLVKVRPLPRGPIAAIYITNRGPDTTFYARLEIEGMILEPTWIKGGSFLQRHDSGMLRLAYSVTSDRNERLLIFDDAGLPNGHGAPIRQRAGLKVDAQLVIFRGEPRGLAYRHPHRPFKASLYIRIHDDGSLSVETP